MGKKGERPRERWKQEEMEGTRKEGKAVCSSTSRKAGLMGWTLTWARARLSLILPVSASFPNYLPVCLPFHVFTLACCPGCFVCQKGIPGMLFRQACLPAMPTYLTRSAKQMQGRAKGQINSSLIQPYPLSCWFNPPFAY